MTNSPANLLKDKLCCHLLREQRQGHAGHQFGPLSLSNFDGLCHELHPNALTSEFSTASTRRN